MYNYYAKSAKSKMYNYSRSEFCPHPLVTHWRFIIPSIFWCRGQSGHSGFPVVLAFRSFRLSGRSGSQSFQLSGPSSCPAILTSSGRSGHRIQKKLEKEKRTEVTEKFTACCLLSNNSPINFAGVSGNRNMYFKRILHVQKKKESQSPHFDKILYTRHLSHSSPFSLYSTFKPSLSINLPIRLHSFQNSL
jgi:hypothetical protein